MRSVVKENKSRAWSVNDLSVYNRPTNTELLLTIHALELIYFDSYTKETIKKQLYISDSSNFPPLLWRKVAKGLAVTQVF